jgi:hypothetical protein
MEQRVIMSHKEMGVYLGSCMGLGFWSKLDPAGQDSAVTFDDIAQALRVVAEWDDPLPPKSLMFTHVEVEGNYATMQQCVAVGLEGWELKQ